MHLGDAHITIAVGAKGITILHASGDAAAAKAAYDKAGDEFDAVGILAHPACFVTRYPQQEKATAKERREAAKRVENAEREAKARELEEGKKRMTQLREQMKALEKQLAA